MTVCVWIEDKREHQYIIRFYHDKPPTEAKHIFTLRSIETPYGFIPCNSIIPFTGEISGDCFTGVWERHCVRVPSHDATLFIRWE